MTKLQSLIVGVIASFLPCLIMVSLRANFDGDWNNHIWAMDYYGEYLRRHFDFPTVLNAPHYPGMPFPIFYGFLFFKVFGVLCTVFSGGAMLRIAAFAVFLAQFRVVTELFRKLGTGDLLAHTVACLMIWAIYPLTNLYARSAFPEFFAVSFLTLSVCSLLLFYLEEGGGTWKRRRLAFTSLFFYTFAVGTHPITGFYGTLFLAMIVLLVGIRRGASVLKRDSRELLAPALLSLFILAPWISTTGHFNSKLGITGDIRGGIWMFSDSIDSPRNRWVPYPYDRRVGDAHGNVKEVSTPYLDAQMNMPLIILCVFLLFGTARIRGAGWTPWRYWTPIGVALLAFVAFYEFSVNIWWFRYLPQPLRMIQYVYRYVSYQNLSIFAVIVFASWSAHRSRVPRLPKALLAFCLLLSFTGLVIREVHAFARRTTDNPDHVFRTVEDRAHEIAWVGVFNACGNRDYATSALFPASSQDDEARLVPVAFEADDGASFGDLHPVQLNFAQPQWLKTQVVAFAWGAFFIDGQPVRHEDLRTWGRNYFALPVPAGPHQLEYRLVPNSIWAFFNRVTFVAFALWGLALLSGLRRKSLSRVFDSARHTLTLMLEKRGPNRDMSRAQK